MPEHLPLSKAELRGPMWSSRVEDFDNLSLLLIISLISQDGSNINKAEMDETASNVAPNDEGAGRQLTKEVGG